MGMKYFGMSVVAVFVCLLCLSIVHARVEDFSMCPNGSMITYDNSSASLNCLQHFRGYFQGGENMFVTAQNTNYVVNGWYFSMLTDGTFTAYNIILGTPLSIADGGTGVTDLNELKDELGLYGHTDTITFTTQPFRWVVDGHTYEYPDTSGVVGFHSRSVKDLSHVKAVRMIVNSGGCKGQVSVCAQNTAQLWNANDDRPCANLDESSGLKYSDWTYLDGSVSEQELYIVATGKPSGICNLGMMQIQFKE